MGIDFGFGLALLLITWGTPLVGFIPALVGWNRIASQWNGTGQREIPKALCALTASICIGPVGFCVVEIIDRLDPTSRSLADFVNRLLIMFLVFGFTLSLIALVIAVCERSAARATVLIGSIAVAVVNVIGFNWLFSTSQSISLWTN